MMDQIGLVNTMEVYLTHILACMLAPMVAWTFSMGISGGHSVYGTLQKHNPKAPPYFGSFFVMSMIPCILFGISDAMVFLKHPSDVYVVMIVVAFHGIGYLMPSLWIVCLLHLRMAILSFLMICSWVLWMMIFTICAICAYGFDAIVLLSMTLALLFSVELSRVVLGFTFNPPPYIKCGTIMDDSTLITSGRSGPISSENTDGTQRPPSERDECHHGTPQTIPKIKKYN